MTTLVWAYKPLQELQGQTGFVECDEDVAKDLIASGEAQDLNVGGFHLKEIESTEYATKDMAPAKRRTASKARSDDSEE